MQVAAQACRSVYTTIYVPIVINTHMRSHGHLLHTIWAWFCWVRTHTQACLEAVSKQSCKEQCPHQQPVLRHVLACAFVSACILDRESPVVPMYIPAHPGDKPPCHVHMPPATPTHPRQQHGVHVCGCLAASVRVYVKHMHTHSARDTVFKNSVHRLDVRAPSADADPHLPGIALGCSCSPTAGQMHNLPVQWEGSGFLDQKEH